MTTLFAFLHHVAAFVLFSALMIELVLLRGEITQWSARKLLRFDMIYGIAAGAVIVIGIARVWQFEKGHEYYLHSAPFLAKMGIFLVVGLLSIYPTLEYMSWRKALDAGAAPTIAPETMRKLRLVVHAELTGLIVMLLMAAMMARGVGFFG